jgi:succinate-semialdehyde dehydrogenase/glutarate-semialdehyde dehydrogenase
MKEFKQLIGGNLVDGLDKKYDIYNPSNGEVLHSLNKASKAQALEALDYADKAFKTWSKLSLSQRELHIRNFISVLKENRDEVVDLLIKETGKTQSTAEYDFDMLPDCLNFFINEAKSQTGSMIPDYDNEHISVVFKKPVGVVVGYLAWNFPLLNLGYKLGPILASGCTCVLKPSSETPLATMMIGELAVKAGIPSGVINILVGSGQDIAQTLSSSTIPSMLTLIGSSETGRKIIEQSATSVKHFSLELGGNAPVVVFKDADIKSAAINTASGKIGNSGQVCVAPNRVFVHKDVKEQFIKEVVDYTKQFTFGCGKDEGEVVVGPIVSKAAQNHMQELVDDAVAKGAKIEFGGKKGDKGFFFEPTVLSNVNESMLCYKTEIFGPILPILTFDDNDDIVERANDTIYGLASYVYTKDLSTALKMSEQIDSGNVCVNEPFYNYNLPHGGCKESGIGKDCSTISLSEYYYVQRVTIKK